MKTKKEIANSLGIDEEDIFTLDEFIEEIDTGCINHYDGIGCFHDGENETDIDVWNDSLEWEDVKDYPYVCWYNK